MQLSVSSAIVEHFRRQIDWSLPVPVIAAAAKQAMGGDVRQAEALLWKCWEIAAGGAPGNRPHAGSDLANRVVEVIKAVLPWWDGTSAEVQAA